MNKNDSKRNLIFENLRREGYSTTNTDKKTIYSKYIWLNYIFINVYINY